MTNGPLFMGILNVTPDSFSDGGTYQHIEHAVAQAEKLQADGADILDLGGESTRPGAIPVSAADELARVVPMLMSIRKKVSIPISIDTTKSEVAAACLAEGADIINDISGLTFDPHMAEVCAKAECGIVCMHIQGTPQTMQLDPHYDDCVSEVTSWLDARIQALIAHGIQRECIIIDPGIGFGKTAQHNVELLSNISAIKSLGCPVLIGHSRKRFLSKILQRPLDEKESGTIGVTLAVASQGADIIRVHDVAANKEAWLAYQAIACGKID
jgi:dihydropteroate synthase